MKRINWTQAFAEVALILVGLGLALVVDQWRDRARERAAERAHLLALRADFQVADSILEVRLGAIEEQLEHNEALLGVLAGPVGSVSGDSIARTLRKAFIDIPVYVEIVSYRDLLNSGELALIRSEALRRALAEFDAVNRRADAFSGKAAEQWAGPVTDFFARQLNVTAIYGRASEVAWSTPGMPTLPAYDRNRFVARLGVGNGAYWSPELVNRIAIKNVTLGDAALHLEWSLQWIDQVFSLIETSLADPPGARPAPGR